MNDIGILTARPERLEKPPPAAPDHFVQFYEKDAVLVESLARYVRNGLQSGAGAIVIATGEHVAQMTALWTEQGFESEWAGKRGQLLILDADETLASLCGEGHSPDPRLFDERIGGLVRDLCARFGHVVAFGEMVGLLWARGRHDEAVKLESLWNRLAHKNPFALYCAYRMSECAAHGETGAFRAICEAHSHVTPAESYFEAGDEATQLRMLAELQHRSGALQREVEARRQAEDDLSDFLENAVVGLHRVGPDGTILWANQAEIRMLGYAPGEYIGRNIAEFHADGAALERILDRLSAGESLRDVPVRLRCKDGSIRHVLLSSNALIRDGKLVHTRCFTRDVSDRWLAQEALRERGAVLHLAMQGARMGYWVADLERGTLRGSHELASLLGLSSAFDWSLEVFLALLHPADRAAFRRNLDAAIAGRREFTAEFRVRADTNTWRWYEGRGEAIYDDAGSPTRFYGICMDVTGRKRDEEQLAHMAAVVDSADDAIVSKTLDGVVKSWNGGATRIFGYEPEEMIGRPITVIIPPELHHEEAAILSRIRAGERVEHYVTTRVTKDGVRKKVSLTVSPVRNSSGEIIGASKIGRVVA
jgi:PAS domain S-box-containing protein